MVGEALRLDLPTLDRRVGLSLDEALAVRRTRLDLSRPPDTRTP